MRRAILIAESLAPVVLWIDEMEKAFSGVRSSAISDSGTTARVVGTFLTWIQEKTSPVFIAATANAIEDLPPELLRKGRFDEIFFVDLPEFPERRDIFSIHLRKRDRNPDLYNLHDLAKASEGHSGSEIEESIVSGMHHAFFQDRELNTEDILDSLSETVPLSQIMREEIEYMRDWSKDRARHASIRRGQPAHPEPE